MTGDEVSARAWDAVDVVLVTGDAYVDHPSFAMAILGRVLQSEGFRVAVLSQPDWHSCEPWRTFGGPRLCFAISAGNLDSMLNHYTASRKVRNDDAFSPGGQTGRRPDRATAVYCQRAREAYPGVPIVAGGVEASLRRLAHYDYWSDRVRRSIILDAKAELVVYGMGEQPLPQIARRLAAGQTVRELRDLRSIVYRLGASESLPEARWPTLVLPSFDEVASDRRAFAEMTRLVHGETNPYTARRLVQYHGREAVVVNPPQQPMTTGQLDRVFGLPFTRRPHPSYGKQRIPALEVVKDSIQILRGCFGGCTFCSLTLHQGRTIQSRSQESILAEVRRIVGQPGSKGVISDLGGPTANMYAMHCTRSKMGHACRHQTCLSRTSGSICSALSTDHGPLLRLMEAVRREPGVSKVLIASGVRMDLAVKCPQYIAELARHHTGGLLKVAPEHSDPAVLARMRKPRIEVFEAFAKAFDAASAAAGKEQYLVPYFMAGHPGCDLRAMIELALFLKRTGYRPDKVQDFIPVPMDIATCMYYTGLDPSTGEEVYVARGERERRLQRAVLQFWKPENYADVRKALEEADRTDLIGDGPECLIPSRAPKTAAQGKRARKPAPPAARKSPGPGYRPHRKTARRRE